MVIIAYSKKRKELPVDHFIIGFTVGFKKVSENNEQEEQKIAKA